jgi:hypothetical protein
MAITLDGSTNNIAIGANATGSSFLRLYEDTDNGTNYVDIIAPASITSNRTLTLPDTTGTVLNDQSNIESQVKTATNSSGSAPIYAARAWVNFNGTGTVAIRASGNVTSITDHGTGEYTVNFTTALSDANYSAAGVCYNPGDASSMVAPCTTGAGTEVAPTTTAFRFAVVQRTGSVGDTKFTFISIFR